MSGTATQRRSTRIVTLVSALGAAQAVAIVTQISATGAAVGDSPFGAGDTARIVLKVLAAVFLVVAVTVTGVVVSGATEVVLTGRLPEIALRRLLGAAAGHERSRITRALVRRTALGIAVGAIGGYAVSAAVLAGGPGSSHELRLHASSYLPSPLLIPALALQLVVTCAAVRRGTRAVLDVPPVQALQIAADADTAVPSTFAVAPRASAGVLLAGLALLGFALFGSTQTPLAMLPAVAGGVVSFVGIVSVAPRFVPSLLDRIAALLPRRLSVTLARRTLRRHPVRTSRAVLGVASAVTLVTTFAVGIATFRHAVEQHYAGSSVQGLSRNVLDSVVGVVLVLTAFLTVTAVVALGNAVAFSAWTRRRGTALLRVLGQSDEQTRAAILAQSLLLSLTATVLGLTLGTGYGWIGAQSVFGAEAAGHLVTPVVPVALVAGAIAGVVVLTLASSIVPLRVALRLPPIRAYLAT